MYILYPTGILKEAPVNTDPDQILNYTCGCYPSLNDTPTYTLDGLTVGVTQANLNSSLVKYVVGFDWDYFNKTRKSIHKLSKLY